VRTLEPAHVLDDADHRHIHALEHLRPRSASPIATSCGVVTMIAPVDFRRLNERELRVARFPAADRR
jgi:hypothetical protein